MTYELNVIYKAFEFQIPLDHCAPLVWWSLYKYKCLWSVEGKGRNSNL